MQECVQRLFHPSIKLIASFLVQPIRLREGETNGISENSKILDDELFVLLLIINQHLLTLSINKELRRDTLPRLHSTSKHCVIQSAQR